MVDPRQSPVSFTGFTFTDDTTDREITEVEAFQHPAGDPGIGHNLPLTPNGNGWTWSAGSSARTDINGVSFSFKGAGGKWSPMLTVGWSNEEPNRMANASINCTGEDGNYSIVETIATQTWLQ